jgi:hypothetical protein
LINITQSLHFLPDWFFVLAQRYPVQARRYAAWLDLLLRQCGYDEKYVGLWCG